MARVVIEDLKVEPSELNKKEMKGIFGGASFSSGTQAFPSETYFPDSTFNVDSNLINSDSLSQTSIPNTYADTW